MSETLAAPAVATAEWELCKGCRAVVHGKRLARKLRVCPDCGHHFRLTAAERLASLLDPGSATMIEFTVPDTDPLAFVDSVAYPRRRTEARHRTGLNEAAVCATGTIGGWPLVLVCMDFRFLGGSLGSAVGEIVTRAAELAELERLPLLVVTASGGARMQEGAISLMQMAKTSQAFQRLDRAGILTLSLITDPTFGGVAASYATLADVIIAEPGARLGFAGPRVIEQTIHQPLPAGFQTAEHLLANGLLDLVRPRSELRATLGRLLGIGSPDTRASWTSEHGRVTITDPAELPEVDSWLAVCHARDIGRPTADDYIARICEDFVELRGDRLGHDCSAVVGGLARIGENPILVLGNRKGHTAAELTAHNFGMASPAGYRKSARLLRLAAKLDIPVLTLIDTPGAYPGLTAEQHGQAFAIAENLRLMAGLGVPSVAVVIGEGGSGGALALAVTDRVLICANAVYSVISPEGCAAILWKDKAAASIAAAALRLDARQLLRQGVVDGVIAEPAGGAQRDHQDAADRLSAAVRAAFAELTVLPPAERAHRKHERFRRY
jgi:acyl-CoA carboxylase subunit beta